MAPFSKEQIARRLRIMVANRPRFISADCPYLLAAAEILEASVDFPTREQGCLLHELIEKLERLKEEHGDIPVCYQLHSCHSRLDLDDIVVTEFAEVSNVLHEMDAASRPYYPNDKKELYVVFPGN